MRDSAVICLRGATPDEVLAIFQDEYRHTVELDPEAEPGYEISFELSIADWRQTCDLVRWKRLGRALNTQFKIDVPDAAWYAALEPEETRSLGGVCELIASRALLPAVQPVRIMGAACTAAGAFLTLRSLLRERGIPVTGIRPSSELEPHLRVNLSEVLWEVVGLAPGAVPTPKVHKHPLHNFFVPLFLLSFALLILSGVVALTGWLFPPLVQWIPPFVGSAVVGLIWCSIIGAILTSRLPIRAVEWGGLRTFRDLAVAMAPYVRT